MTIQFSHANGFPAKSYQCLFNHFSDYDIEYIDSFGIKPYTVTNSWMPLVDRLIEHIEANSEEPVIGIGHSLGGIITHFAAQKRPDLFDRIILLDPPMFRYSKRKIIGLLDKLNLIDRVDNPSKKAKTRRTNFKNYTEARTYLEPKTFFKNFNPFCFEAYVLEAFVKSENGLTLKIPASQEYQIFRKLPTKFGKPAQLDKAFFVYGNKHEVLEFKDINSLKKEFPNYEFIPFSGGHMFPLEKPDELSKLLHQLFVK